MPREPVTTSILRPQELKAVYAISNAVSEATDIDDALGKITELTRPVLIFDNIVVYVPVKEGHLEATYARIIGRGRTAESELTWGEQIASDVYKTGETATRYEKLPKWETNRLNLRYLLGLPLRWRQQMLGTLVFGRFGGPPYSPDQIHLAEFVSIHIAQLLVRQQLVDQIASLEADRRLRQLQDNFIATISHELNTPLGFIKGYATTLLREDIEWDEKTQREFLEIIDEETDRLKDLIENLMDSSRLQSGTLRMKKQQIRLDMFLRELVVRASARFQDVEIKLGKMEEVRVIADPVRLTQVFDNLTSNAQKYAAGTPVVIAMEVLDQNSVRIIFRDHGPGIASDHLDRLFDRFYRVPENIDSVHGTGLGLYICRKIIRVHGGEITVKSKLGEGTAFIIHLPIGQKQVEPSEAGRLEL